MPVAKTDRLTIANGDDVVRVRQVVRGYAVEIGLSLVDQTKIVTAASELGRNALDHGGGGTVTVEILHEGTRKGLGLIFEDRGPGIPDIEKAMTDHFSTGKGLGLGLGGAKRLSNEFQIESTPGVGTRVAIRRWK